MWLVVVVGSHYWPVWAPAVSQVRREPCRKHLWTVVSWRCSLPVYKVGEMVKPRSGLCELAHCQTTQLVSYKSKRRIKESRSRRHWGLRVSNRADRKKKHRVFTRGRGMLHPSVGLGGSRAGLAGGGVSSPLDKLDSGELIGVSVTEEISRQESDLMLWHQKRAEGLCSMYASLAAFMCSGWQKMADRQWAERDNIIQSRRVREVWVIASAGGCQKYWHLA